MADYTVSNHIDNFMQGLNALESRAELGLGTLATLNAAPAGTVTGTTLAANVVTSSLTSVGTLGSLTVTGTSTLGMTTATSGTFPPFEGVRTVAAAGNFSAAGSFLAASSTTVTDGHGAGVTFRISGTALAPTIIGNIGAVRAGADTTGDLVFRTYLLGVSSEAARMTSNNKLLLGYTTDQGTGTVQILGGLGLDKTITPAGTTGARTINKAAGSVNFAAAATSLVVTNSLVTGNSVIQATIGNDSTAKSVTCVAAAGSFTLRPGAAPTGEVRADFLVIN